MRIREMVEMAYRTSTNKGWWDDTAPDSDDFVPEKLALIHSEVSEALEAYRDGEMSMFFRDGLSSAKPLGFPSEIADVVIRIGDLCGRLGIDLEQAIAAKMAYNETRAHRHGGKRC